VADMVVELANAMPVNRSVKVIANNSACFLVIVTNLYKSNKNASREKKTKSFYTPLYIVISERLRKYGV
jgi:uncharacterized phosphosugar-binding protein